MAEDDLSAPLGQKKRKPPAKLPALVPKAIAGILLLSLVGAGLWAATVDDPLGGEPVAVVDTVSAQAGKSGEAGPGGGATARHDGNASGPRIAATETPQQPAGKTVNIIDGASGKTQQVVLPSPNDAKPAPPVDPKLLETTRHGAIPRIGPDGARPSTIYAQPLKATAKSDVPRIAIIVSGLGVSASATSDALTKLPSAVTLAFTPYGNDLERLVGSARGGHHEVLLQAPMEPFDYPDNDPGPQTLLTSLSADQNIDRLQWLMSRFQGYVGIATYMGARFTASEGALGPILRETGKRGLIFVDDGASPRSLSGQLAGAANVPFAKADIIIDSVPTAVDIERALGRLEAIARERGVAVGVSSASPAVIARLADWAKRIEARGVMLVPITAVAIKAKSS
ncbi:MAG TPA: divergent polysaccharide deacetylase family protein [Pseudolabrys sp.]|nr:divergent polysaccharide deacetylase family protein [Pseudolabrys sp.]